MEIWQLAYISHPIIDKKKDMSQTCSSATMFLNVEIREEAQYVCDVHARDTPEVGCRGIELWCPTEVKLPPAKINLKDELFSTWVFA